MAPLAPGNSLILPLSTGRVPATILALQGHSVLVELRPPGDAPTSLVVLNLFELLCQPDRPSVGRMLEYTSLPLPWLRAIVEAGGSWIGRPQEGSPIPPPTTLFHQRDCTQSLIQFLQGGSGRCLLTALQKDEPWIRGWSQGACVVLAEALCFWIRDAQAEKAQAPVRVCLRFLSYTPIRPFHAVTSMARGSQEYLLDAEGVWSPAVLLSWHTRQGPSCLLDEREEFFSDLLRDPVRSRAWADQFQRHLGTFPLQAFFPGRGEQSGSTMLDKSA